MLNHTHRGVTIYDAQEGSLLGRRGAHSSLFGFSLLVDILCLLVLVPALWLESRVLVSTMAVAVFLLESLWILDFMAGGDLVQIAACMFDPEEPMHTRILLWLFHFALPLVMFFMLWRLGYAKCALPLQIVVAAVVLPLTYLLTDPVDKHQLGFRACGTTERVAIADVSGGAVHCAHGLHIYSIPPVVQAFFQPTLSASAEERYSCSNPFGRQWLNSLICFKPQHA